MGFDYRPVEEQLTLLSSPEKMQFIHSVPLALYGIMRACLNQWTFTAWTVNFSQHETRLAQRFKMRSGSPKGPVSHSGILPTSRGVLNT